MGILQLEINLSREEITIEEAEYLIKQLEASELALNKFLKGMISFQDYCDILQLCGVDVDAYLINLENNLAAQCLI